MKYTFKDNAYFLKQKDDPRDRIEVELGDSKQPDKFYPQVKIERWDNEVNFSARLKDEGLEPETVTTDKDKVVWSKGKREVNLYELENGYEFEVILKEKPESNVIEFSLETKGLDFFYQPELTQEEKDRGDIRPENVIGSYAVYASENKANYVGGKEYKCGKVGHIYRPKIIDSAGTEVWGELHIENGILSVTIPQDFLDKAVYPVIVDPTFGYTGEPATSATWGDNYWRAWPGTPVDGDGTVTSIKLWCKKLGNSGVHFKGVLVNTSLNIVTNGVTNDTDINNAGIEWVEATYATSPSVVNDTSYWVGAVCIYAYFHYDSVSGGRRDTSNSVDTPTNPTDSSASSVRIGIYATYTAGGGGETVGTSKMSLLGVGN